MTNSLLDQFEKLIVNMANGMITMEEYESLKSQTFKLGNS